MIMTAPAMHHLISRVTVPCPHCAALLGVALFDPSPVAFAVLNPQPPCTAAAPTMVATGAPVDPAERFRQAQARKAAQASAPVPVIAPVDPPPRYTPKPSSVAGLTLAALPAINEGGLTSFELAKRTKKPHPQVQSALSVLFAQGLATRDPVPHPVPRQRGGTVYRWRRAS